MDYGSVCLGGVLHQKSFLVLATGGSYIMVPCHPSGSMYHFYLDLIQLDIYCLVGL